MAHVLDRDTDTPQNEPVNIEQIKNTLVTTATKSKTIKNRIEILKNAIENFGEWIKHFNGDKPLQDPITYHALLISFEIIVTTMKECNIKGVFFNKLMDFCEEENKSFVDTLRIDRINIFHKFEFDKAPNILKNFSKLLPAMENVLLL